MDQNERLRDIVAKLTARVDQLEKDVKTLAGGLQAASVDIEAEWGEEILPHGTEVAGVKFEF